MTSTNSWNAGEGCKVHARALLGCGKTKRKRSVSF